MIADGWSIDARISPTQFRLVLCVKPREVKLRFAREAITYLFPVYQVLAVEDRYAREILERAIDKVEVLSVCTHTWVGMKAGKHRVAVALSLNVQRRYNSDRDYE
jgi:hypothetical protein